MLPPPRRRRGPRKAEPDTPRYRYYEDGEITKVWGNGLYDVTVAGRDFPYEKLFPTDRESVFELGEEVRIGFLENSPYLPQIVGRKSGSNRHIPYPGRTHESGRGPTHRKKPGDGSLPKKVKLLPGWLTWGAYGSFGHYVSIALESAKKYLHEEPVPVFNLLGSGMLRTLVAHGIALGREPLGPDEQPHYVIIMANNPSPQVLYRMNFTWEPYVPAGDYGGHGPVPMRLILSDDAKLALTLWGATNGGSWGSTAPTPNIGGPQCRDE